MRRELWKVLYSGKIWYQVAYNQSQLDRNARRSVVQDASGLLILSILVASSAESDLKDSSGKRQL